MTLFLIIVFSLSLFLLLYSYILYPILLKVLVKYRSRSRAQYQANHDLPYISVLMAVYNEDGVIEKKMQTLLQSDYPKEKLSIYIGSDNSNDNTNKILEKIAEESDQVNFYPFTVRSGKQGVVNQLSDIIVADKAMDKHHILVFTDANVMLEEKTIFNLARNFKDPEVGLVDTHMINTDAVDAGIGKSEKRYISYEVQIKHFEGLIWGALQGPFGGCFALRSHLFQKIPIEFLVDDFFLTTKVFEAGYKAISDLDARCYEKLPQEMKVEFSRKSRISAGNFQNLVNAANLLWPPYSPIAFSFFSHKVLRWVGPILMLFMAVTAIVLALIGSYFFKVLCIFGLFIALILPLLDLILEKQKIHIGLLRNIRYFLLMNIALLKGFIRYLKGVKSGIWEPTKR